MNRRGDSRPQPRGKPPGSPRGPSATWVALLAVIAVACGAGTAAADGDPASDTLLQQNVYFPYNAPAASARKPLLDAVDGIYAQGNRVKVALISDLTDLGSVGALFGKPDDYAHFLGIELGLWYVGPLLVAMPTGFGIYDGGRSTAAEQAALRGLRVDASSPVAFASSATVALQRLAAARALTSTDIRPPLVDAHPAFAKRGKPATLRFDVFDDSGRSKAIVRVYESGRLLATIPSPVAFQIGTRKVGVRWRVPAKLASRNLRYCVVAVDPAGNRSRSTCAPFLRVS